MGLDSGVLTQDGPALRGALLGLSVLVVLREKRPEIAGFLLVLDAGKYHLGTWDFRLGVLDVVLELCLVPGDAGILVGVRIGVTRRRAGLAAVESVELRTDLVLGACADRMAGHAFVERRLAGRDVLRQHGRGDCRRCDDGQRAQGQFFHGVLVVGFGGGGGGAAVRYCMGRSWWTRREARS